MTVQAMPPQPPFLQAKFATTILTTLLILVTLPALAAATPPSQLTAEEMKEGWRLLFDGQTTAGWRGFTKTNFPARGWAVTNGCLLKIPRVSGGHIVTIDTFLNFDLKWEWRILPKGNNGVKYFVRESMPNAPGHEYQMIDDTGIDSPKGRTASFYDVLPPAAETAPRPPGEWNDSRIVVRSEKVEHWLNGRLVLSCSLNSETVRQAIAQSKFRDVPGFGRPHRGPIMLTDHGDEAWFRSIKIRPFDP